MNGSGRTNREEKKQLKGSVEMEETRHITLNSWSKEIIWYQNTKCKRDVAKWKEWDKVKEKWWKIAIFRNNLQGKQGGRKDLTEHPFVRKKRQKKKKGGKKLQRAHASLNWLEKKSEIKSKYKIKWDS